MSSNLQLS